MAAQVTTFSSRLVPLPLRNIDTDQIIPARFLKITSKDGLADGLFADWRNDPEFVLNKKENQGAQVLLVGDNFGCGSSREHAPWALVAHGFKAVISTSFADIFKNNALKNGLLPIELKPSVVQHLFKLREQDANTKVEVNLEQQTLGYKSAEVKFAVDGFARQCLLDGVDQLGYLQSLEVEINAYESARAKKPWG